MSMIANTNKSDVAVENLRPLSSDPELPPVTLSPEPTKTASDSDVQAETDNKSTDKIIATDKKPSISEDKTAAIESDNQTVSKENTELDKTPKSLIPRPKPEGKVKKPASPKKKKQLSTDDPLYRVQLAAFRNADKAAEVASLLTQKHRTRLNDIILETTKIETKDNGIFWRIVTETLARADADDLCTLLKRAGQDCILRKVKTVDQ